MQRPGDLATSRMTPYQDELVCVVIRSEFRERTGNGESGDLA
jgi:hypothetical protein